VRTADDVGARCAPGADKVSINSAAVEPPEVLTESAWRFGAQCVVASIDAKWDAGAGIFRVYVKGGRAAHGARGGGVGRGVRAARRRREPAHEHRPRRRAHGYDLPLTRAVADAVDVPVIASGGAGRRRTCATRSSTGAPTRRSSPASCTTA
jgi:cyclase